MKKNLFLIGLLMIITLTQLIMSNNIFIYTVIFIYAIIFYLTTRYSGKMLYRFSQKKEIFNTNLYVFIGIKEKAFTYGKDIFVSSSLLEDETNARVIVEHEKIHATKHVQLIKMSVYLMVTSNILDIYGIIVGNYIIILLGILMMVLTIIMRKSLEIEADILASKKVGKSSYIIMLEWLANHSSKLNNPSNIWMKIVVVLLSTHPTINTRIKKVLTSR